MGAKRNPNAVHCNVAVEKVTDRMKAVCIVCEEPPKRWRLVNIIGSGRFQQQKVYCISHGVDFINDVRSHLTELKELLLAEVGRKS